VSRVLPRKPSPLRDEGGYSKRSKLTEVEDCYLKPLSRRWSLVSESGPAKEAITFQDNSTTMNLEMAEPTYGASSNKSESESIGSPVSFFSRDSNMSMSSSPDNFLNNSCHSFSMAAAAAAGTDTASCSAKSIGASVGGGGANGKRTEDDQVSVSADDSVSRHSRGSGDHQLPSNSDASVSGPNREPSFNYEAEWAQISQILATFGEGAQGGVQGGPPPQGPSPPVKPSNATTPNNCKVQLAG